MGACVVVLTCVLTTTERETSVGVSVSGLLIGRRQFLVTGGKLGGESAWRM